MARARTRPAAASDPAGVSAAGSLGGAVARARSPHTTQAATDLAQLLRARSFSIGGSGAAVARVQGNLESAGSAARLDEGALAWVGLGAVPEGRLGVSLGEAPGVLGPHSFGFLNNLEDIAPLAAPIAERPRKGGLAVVVPRRDALPEVVPLLCSRGLGISWLISVGDGDPAEVLRFLRLDPATRAVLCALGRGARAQTLHEAIAADGKPLVLLEPAALSSLAAGAGRDPVLLRAVARRAGATVTHGLEEWLAHGAVVEARAALPAALAAVPAGRERGRARRETRARAAVVVLGAGADFVAAEVLPLSDRDAPARVLPPVSVDGDDEPAVEAALRSASERAEVVLVCGPPDQTALTAGLRASVPILSVDPTETARLRAMLRALTAPRQDTDPEGAATDRRPVEVRPERGRIEGVLAELPPPLYIGDAAVSDEVLGDHDLKRLLHAYGARVSRQAPANNATAALRIVQKLALPVQIVPALPPRADGAEAAAAESREAVLCTTQAEVKRHATLLLARGPYVILREPVPAAPRMRLLVGPERGLGAVLRVSAPEAPAPTAGTGLAEAALLPILRIEARALASLTAAAHKLGEAAEGALAELIGQLAACASAHELSLDLQLYLSDEPLVAHAAGVLKRQSPGQSQRQSQSQIQRQTPDRPAAGPRRR